MGLGPGARGVGEWGGREAWGAVGEGTVGDWGRLVWGARMLWGCPGARACVGGGAGP